MGRTTPTVRQVLEMISARVSHCDLLNEEEKTLSRMILDLGRKHSDAILATGMEPEIGIVFFALMEIMKGRYMRDDGVE